jgi:hypothetical protein
MTDRIGSAGIVASLMVLVTCGAAQAQVPADERWSVSVKAGSNHEQAEDGLSGSSAAAAAAFGFSLTSAWSAEVELWVPGFITNSSGAGHRDIHVSFSMVRSFDGARLRPYVLAGASAARTEDRSTICFGRSAPPPGSAATTSTFSVVSCSEPDVLERRNARHTSTTTYLVGGAGVEVPLGRAIRIVPEVRVHASPASVIVRTAVGMKLVF